MAKTRLSSLDIAILARQLHSQLAGSRLTNAFTIKNKQYLLRFYHFGSRKSDEEKKPQLLIRPGERIGLTSYDRTKTPVPDYFANQVRKILRSAKVLRVMQIGYDRVIDFVFRVHDTIYHILFEFYAKGNIILTDQDLVVITSTRHHAGHCEKGKVYRCDNLKQERTRLTLEKLTHIIGTASPDNTFRNLLTQKTDLGSSVILQALRSVGIGRNAKVGNGLDSNQLAALYAFFDACDSQIDEIFENDPFALDVSFKGYLYKDEDGVPDDIMPFKIPNCDAEIETFDDYSACVDAYYTYIELSKLNAPQTTEDIIESRLSNLDKNVSEKVTVLKETQDINERYGNCILENLDTVDQTRQYMEDLLNQLGNGGLDKMVKAEKEGFTELSITDYDPLKKTFGLSLFDEDGSELVIRIFIELTTQANAGYYFSLYKDAGHSLTKTQERYEIAKENVIATAKTSAKQVKANEMSVIERRKGLWFEKFYWFISSENYLVIAGNNVQQNEVIVKNYMQPNDVYIHASIHGAASVVIKQLPFDQIIECYPSARAAVLKKKANRILYHPIPTQTLNEAAQFSISHSSFWTEELVGEVSWVWGHQVSKTAQSGEFLPAGSFMIRGERNYLKAPLPELALAYLHLITTPRQQRAPLAIELMDEGAEEPKIKLEAPTKISFDEPEQDSAEENESTASETEQNPKQKKHGYSTAVKRLGRKISDERKIPLSEALELAQEELATREPRAPNALTQRELRELKEQMEDPSDKWAPKTKQERKQQRKDKRNMKKSMAEMEQAMYSTVSQHFSNDQDEIHEEEIPEAHNVFCKYCGSLKHIDIDCDRKIQTIPELQYFNKEKKEIQKMEAELGEKPASSSDQQLTSGSSLNILVNEILADDEVKITLPFLAPYDAVRRYPFKIKISRGDNDRSKIVKLINCLTASESWRKDSGLDTLNAQAIDSVPNEIITRQLIGSLKVTARNSSSVMQKAIKKQKAEKKNSKKAK